MKITAENNLFARLGAKARIGLLTTLCVVMLAGCSTGKTYEDDVYDPLEPYNRVIFSVNDGIDTVLIRPVTIGYVNVVPEALRVSLRSFLRNLKSPIIVGNNLLQGDVDGAWYATKRMVVNSTVGFGGLADVAGHHGLPFEDEDFGQTLAVWGVGAGPYIVWPILGPSNARDTVGMVADGYADPTNRWLDNTDQEEYIYARAAATGLVNRAALLDELDKIKAESLDYYASIRAMYDMYRRAQIKDEKSDAYGVTQSIPDYPEIPEYDDE